MTVKQLLEQIDSAEFSEWVAYWKLEPFGPLRDDLRTGTLAAIAANTWRGKDSPRLPEDFFPELGTKKPAQANDLEKKLGLFVACLRHVRMQNQAKQRSAKSEVSRR